MPFADIENQLKISAARAAEQASFQRKLDQGAEQGHFKKYLDQRAAKARQKVDPKIARLLAQAAHPSTAGTAPKLRVVDVAAGFDPLTSPWPEMKPGTGHRFPRAVVRSVPGLAEGERVWVSKIWFSVSKPVLVNGQPVARSFATREEALAWGQRTADQFRQANTFWIHGSLGTPLRRWETKW